VVLVGAGGLVGVLVGGRLADRLVAQGDINGRVMVAGVSAIATVALFLPGLLAGSLVVTLPLFMLAAAAFAARNPALDAARLDIMHHRLWGRAEAVRTMLRQLMVAVSPLVFGFLADTLASGQAASANQHGFGAQASAAGLKITYLLLLVTLLVSGLLTLKARQTYPSDVATAVASEHAFTASS
jgi:MFS family permease